jgi:ribosomal protein L7/L12
MRLLELISDIQALNDKYGTDAVYSTLVFMRDSDVKHLLKESGYTLRANDNSIEVSLTKEQWSEIVNVYNSSSEYNSEGFRYKNKISAIKKLREFTSVGLKEAKDLIESYSFTQYAG